MKNRSHVILCIILILCFTSLQIKAQEATRPPVWGIAKMTFPVTDFQATRDYYSRFLGFDEAFSYNSLEGEIISFKINDRQFVEFIEDKDANDKDKLVKVSFDCDEIQQMYDYLRSKSVMIVKEPETDRAGNLSFTVMGPNNHPIEFIRFMPESLHKRSKGQFLSGNRISKRIHHTGLYVSDVEEADRFFKDILGFSEIWRSKIGNDVKPNYIYLKIPDCIENIEYLVTDNINSNHPCFLVEDMQESIYTLKERANGIKIEKPIVGKGNRWLLTIDDADHISVEFTEAHTIR